ncbi:hypothetical protein GCM10010121_087350 [Streptomyces brasiliensis]|uniref:Uncharacterized protein n=1 Tax=Streptomyces brasiliensis TaxID=1954 RepID=A0A917P5U5_9ACTN|nr:hypothetical protein GCM10010121_087350 [Streptomyces brasiliensis]
MDGTWQLCWRRRPLPVGRSASCLWPEEPSAVAEFEHTVGDQIVTFDGYYFGEAPLEQRWVWFDHRRMMRATRPATAVSALMTAAPTPRGSARVGCTRAR